jgi:hypothetical protein
MVYVLLFGCLSTITYPALAVEVVEAFVELPSINQVKALLLVLEDGDQHLIFCVGIFIP